MSNLKTYSFWQSPSYSENIPPYILLGLASARILLGERFEVLNLNTIKQYLDLSLFKDKIWQFRNESDERKKELMSIIAKSDYIRMALIEKVGGVWIDADTIIIGDYTEHLDSITENSKLIWYTEQFFSADKNNLLLQKASNNMLEADYQTWGNPGLIKNLISDNPEEIKKIPYDLIDPKYVEKYQYASRDIMLSDKIDPKEFLLNNKQCILILYNTPFSQTHWAKMTCEEFLEQNILLSKIFLHINPSKELWIEKVQDILKMINA
ncbi:MULTISPECIES: capsular polysaccharide synthesis protein [unclassified Pasteurella]|uniref:capsular polysaccharide synthesis protein n=1 Tax=unclassified Pasteurella TaxID=2621516 RepID=UPI00107393F6|nr:hypothetical protein [Pasteurella sp. 19428wF3_WM03]TFU49978.1 hypothetical protein E4T92_09985 [Pasteurella sp. WM03]